MNNDYFMCQYPVPNGNIVATVQKSFSGFKASATVLTSTKVLNVFEAYFSHFDDALQALAAFVRSYCIRADREARRL